MRSATSALPAGAAAWTRSAKSSSLPRAAGGAFRRISPTEFFSRRISPTEFFSRRIPPTEFLRRISPTEFLRRISPTEFFRIRCSRRRRSGSEIPGRNSPASPRFSFESRLAGRPKSLAGRPKSLAGRPKPYFRSGLRPSSGSACFNHAHAGSRNGSSRAGPGRLRPSRPDKSPFRPARGPAPAEPRAPRPRRAGGGGVELRSDPENSETPESFGNSETPQSLGIRVPGRPVRARADKGGPRRPEGAFSRVFWCFARGEMLDLPRRARREPWRGVDPSHGGMEHFKNVLMF